MNFDLFCPNEAELPFFEPLLFDRAWEDMEKEGRMVTIGAVDENGLPSGIMVLCLLKNMTARLLYIYVRESARRQGCAETLLKGVMPILSKAGYVQLIAVFAKTKDGRCQEDLKGLFESFGAAYRSVVDHVVAIPAKAIMKKLKKKDIEGVMFLKDIPDYLLRSVYLEMDETDYRRISYFSERINCEPAQTFDSSSCVLVKEGIIQGVLLFVKRCDGKGPILVYMNGADGKVLLELLSASVREASLIYGEDMLLSFATVNGFGGEMGELFKDEGFWVMAERAVINI